MSTRNNEPPLTIEQLLAFIVAQQQQQQQQQQSLVRFSGLTETSRNTSPSSSAVEFLFAQGSLTHSHHAALQQQQVNRNQRIIELCQAIVEANRQLRQANDLLRTLLSETSSHAPQDQLVESIALSIMSSTRNNHAASSQNEPAFQPSTQTALSLLLARQQGQPQEVEDVDTAAGRYSSLSVQEHLLQRSLRNVMPQAAEATALPMPRNNNNERNTTPCGAPSFSGATARAEIATNNDDGHDEDKESEQKRPTPQVSQVGSPTPTSTSRDSSKQAAEKFPKTLFRMLHDMDDHKNEIIAFTPSGSAFHIFHPEAFAKDVLPRYFHHGKLSSFKRQLNLYGFRLLSHGPDAGAYYHETFHRDRREVSEKIVRPNSKN